MFTRRSARRMLVTLFSACLAMPVFAEETEIHGWTAPPYWAPPDFEPRPEHVRTAEGRQAFAASPTALPFISLPPCRLVDTRGNGAPLGNGFTYDPVANQWAAVATTGAPTPCVYHSAVWTGTQMIVWGGYSGFSQTASFYTPSSDTWSSIVNDGTAPQGRYVHSAFWTGSRMVIFGGYSSGPLSQGVWLDPASDWSATNLANSPSPRYNHSAVWTGKQMIVWGGTSTLASRVNFQSGASWQPLSLCQKN